MTQSLKEYSRSEFNDGNPNTFQELQTGCLQRIADATEKMAEPYLSLLRQLESKTKQLDFHCAECDRLEHRVAGLRGYIGRLRGDRKKRH